MFLLDLILECRCNLTGTVNSSNVCDKITGQCPCKQLLTGRTCNQCQVSPLFHVQIFFFIVSQLMSTKQFKKKGLPVLCIMELILNCGEGRERGHFFLRRHSYERRCKFKYFLNRSSLITEK